MKQLFIKLMPTVATCIALLVVLQRTDPRQLSLPLVILPFFLIFLAIYLPVKSLSEYYFSKVSRGGVSSSKSKLVALSAAGLPTFLLVLSSINQLSLKDFLLGAVFVAVLIFYFSHYKAVSR